MCCAHEPDRSRKRKPEAEDPREKKQVKSSDRGREVEANAQIGSSQRVKRTREGAGAPSEGGVAKNNKTQRKAILGGGCDQELAPIVETDEEEGENGKLEPKSTVTVKAVKLDKAKVPRHL
jgi:hypothetical protein